MSKEHPKGCFFKYRSYPINSKHRADENSVKNRMQKGKIMTRDEVKKIFEGATDEQITAFLNSSQKELADAKATGTRWKEEAQKASELQKKIDELEAEKMSDSEKLQKQYEDAVKQLESVKNELEANKRRSTLKESLAKQGIVGENSDKLVESIIGGDFNAELLGEIINTRISDHDKELLTKMSSKGGNPDKKENDKSDAEKIAERFVEGSKTKGPENILENYL